MDDRHEPVGFNCLRTPKREHGFEALTVKLGAIPRSLNGTFYRVGPGRFEDVNGPYEHWFDGEGFLSAIRISDGRAEAACRMIQPAGLADAGYENRGRMGRAPKGLLRRLQSFVDPRAFVNVANTALMMWQGRLFALFEACVPTEIDPETLATREETDFGIIKRALGAHPQLHIDSGDLINQGFVPPPMSKIDYYTFPERGLPRRTHRVSISGRFPAHDLAVTEHNIVTILSPLFIDLPGVVTGRPIAKCLNWRPEKGTEVVLSPIGGGQSKRLEAPAMLYSHTANAFEDGEWCIVHGIAASDASLADWTGRVRRGCRSLSPLPTPGRLTELRIHRQSGRIEVTTLFNAPAEFPTVDPRLTGRRHNVVYGTTYTDETHAYGDFADALARFELEGRGIKKLSFGSGHVVSEPVLVSSGEQEGDGWLLSVNYDGEQDRSYLAIIRAGAGMETAAVVDLPEALPMSLHGLWVAQEPN